MVKALATLSSSGWATTLSEKADYALAYVLLTDNLQSNIYRGHLTSFQAIIQNNLNNMTQLQQELQRALELYLGRIFDAAFVEIGIEDFPLEHGTRVMVTITAKIAEADQEHDLHQIVSFLNGKFEKVNQINTFGITGDMDD